MKLLLIPLLSLLVASQAHAAGRTGLAEVRTGANGIPCFTIPAGEGGTGSAPDFEAIIVSAAGGAVLWRMSMPRERTFPVSAAMCIPYAGRVQALPQTPAAPLENGKLYGVQIDTRPARGGRQPSRYLARFCLLRAPGGQPRVRQIGAGARTENGADAGCSP